MKPFPWKAAPIVLCLWLISGQPAWSRSAPTALSGLDVGSNGAACMHGDSLSSDTTPLPGPGVSQVSVDYANYFAACPAVLIRSDGRPFVLSTAMVARTLVVRLLDRLSGAEAAGLELEAGSLLGGVYAYLDSLDRMVMMDGDQHLIWIRAVPGTSDDDWELVVDESVDLSSAVTGNCGGEGCDAVVSISPGPEGTVWFVTQRAVVGVCYPGEGTGGDRISWLQLGQGERIDNSFSTTPDGRAAIVTDRALYLLVQQDDYQPQLVWRHEYDRGSARKPGQLSHGSGATPTFFGDRSQYVMITDNADDGISLIVRDAMVRGQEEEQGRLICRKQIFTPLINSGTESSAIGFGNTAIVVSTYGYPYPTLPEGAEPSQPEGADFVGGMVRVDVVERTGEESPGDGESETPCECETIWENGLRSAAVPKLSTEAVQLTVDGRTVQDRLLYTVERRSPTGGNGTSIFDTYHFTALRLETGEVAAQSPIGAGYFNDTLQMAGNIGPDGVYWQGTMGGVVRVAPAE